MQTSRLPLSPHRSERRGTVLKSGLMSVSAQASTSANNYSELKPLGRKIMMHIEKLGADTLPADGLAVDSITRAIPGAKLDAVQAEIEDLLGEGLLYTTSDSDQLS